MFTQFDAFAPVRSGKFQEDQYTITVEVEEFSDANVRHTAGRKSSSVLDFGMGSHRVSVYPNHGQDSANRGHVSLEFDISFRRARGEGGDVPPRHVIADTVLYLDLSCVVSVVDAEGRARHPRSFAFRKETVDCKVNFCVENYVSREYLLSSSDELLPDDRLNIQVDFVLGQVYTDYSSLRIPYEILWTSFTTEKSSEGEGYQNYLLLNSVLAERLRRESKFFEGLCAAPMAELGSGKVKLPEIEEFDNLCWILGVLWVPDMAMKFTVQDILDFYAVADLYVMENMLDICRRWLRLLCLKRFLTSKEVSLISRTAEKYDDPFLKNVAEVLGGDCDETDDEWTCVTVEDHKAKTSAEQPDAPQEFLFLRRKRIEEMQRENGEGTEDVSDIANCYI